MIDQIKSESIKHSLFIRMINRGGNSSRRIWKPSKLTLTKLAPLISNELLWLITLLIIINDLLKKN